jgi:hypothetical protein
LPKGVGQLLCFTGRLFAFDYVRFDLWVLFLECTRLFRCRGHGDETPTGSAVFISKSGDKYIAKRESESTLYQLDASSVDALKKSADEIKPVAVPGK